jgi:hypothetical protein
MVCSQSNGLPVVKSKALWRSVPANGRLDGLSNNLPQLAFGLEFRAQRSKGVCCYGNGRVEFGGAAHDDQWSGSALDQNKQRLPPGTVRRFGRLDLRRHPIVYRVDDYATPAVAQVRN